MKKGGRLLNDSRRSALAALAKFPVLRSARQWRYDARFRAGRYHCGYSGVYETFEEAARSLPAGMSGFDHPEMADIDHYTTATDGFEPMPATEYPALFWLRHALDGGARTLIDFGGYVGHAFHQYNPYLDLPDDFVWTVFDLPRIVEAGRKLASKNGPRQLRFADRVDPQQDMDILLAAGSLQYMRENSLQDLLKAGGQRPRHVIVQRTPLHGHKSFVTIQSIITRSGRICFCPYTVAERKRFIADFLTLGYRLIDSWEKDRDLDVPFRPGHRISTYSGLYFRLD